jgi:hypothetical protein
MVPAESVCTTRMAQPCVAECTLTELELQLLSADKQKELDLVIPVARVDGCRAAQARNAGNCDDAATAMLVMLHCPVHSTSMETFTDLAHPGHAPAVLLEP